MLKKKAIKKILLTTFTMMMLMTVYLIPDFRLDKNDEFPISTNLVSNLSINTIYLLNKDGFLVKSNVYSEGETLDEKITNIINSLIINKSDRLPAGYSGVIPGKTKILGVKIENKNAIINFSKDILKVDNYNERKMIEAIIFTTISFDGIESVSIKVDDKLLEELPYSKERISKELNKSFGINKTYNISHKDDVCKIVVYYKENNYYVPVTKYVNDTRDKIKVIIDSLSSSYIYEPNLMTFLNRDLKLLDYSEDNNILSLNFNEALFDSNKRVLEEVIYTISYSVFDNFDVKELIIKVNNQEVIKKMKKDIEL